MTSLRHTPGRRSTNRIFSIITNVMVAYIFCILPLVMWNGYYDIADAKRYTTFGMIAVALIAMIVVTMINPARALWRLRTGTRLCAIDIAMLLWTIVLSISTYMSDETTRAVLGEIGLSMGWVFYMIMAVMYILLRMLHGRLNVRLQTTMLLVSVGILSFIGVCDRYSIYILPVPYRSSEFISTIGNINWICSVLTILFPLVAWAYIATEGRLRILSTVGNILLMMLCAVIGADSVVIVVGMSLVGMLYYTLDNRKYLGRLITFTGLLLTVDWIMTRISRINEFTVLTYGTDYLTYKLGSIIWTLITGLIMLIAGILITWIESHRSDRSTSDEQAKIHRTRIARIVIIVSFIMAGVLYVTVSIINTLSPLPVIGEISYFTFTDRWGNGRGASIYSAVLMLKEVDLKNLLIGAGPECYAVRIGQVGNAAGYVVEHFDALLASAHCIPMTLLINTGILGLVSYYAVFITCIWKNRRYAPCVIPLVTYMIHGLISFDNTMSYPILVTLIAIYCDMVCAEESRMNSVMFHINSLGRGGAERVVTVLADKFVSDGVDVTIVTLWKADDEYEINPKIKRINIADISYVKHSRGKFLAVSRLFALRSIISKSRPDVVISFCNKANFRASLAMWLIDIPLVTSVRNDPEKDYAPYMSSVRRMEKKASGCVFQTADAQNFFDKKWADRGCIILNPLDDRYLQADTWRGNSTGYIMAAGRISKQKNHTLLINAFAQIMDKHPDIELRIYGEESDAGSLENVRACIEETKTTKRVRLMGCTDEMPEVLADAAAFVLPSDYEGMPNALLEAMAVGVPCISTDCPCGGPATVIRDGESGILVPVGDVDRLAEELDKILTDVSLRQRVSAEALKIREEADSHTIYKLWRDYIEGIIKQGE